MRTHRWQWKTTCAAALVLVATPVLGDLHNWVGASGKWEAPGNWNPAAVPVTGDDAYILTAVTVTRDAATPPYGWPGLGEFRVDGTALAAAQLFQNASNMAAYWQYVGYNGRATYVQGVGNNTTGLLSVAYNTGSTGTYLISAATGTLSVGTFLTIGAAANASGTLGHQSGYVNVTGPLTLASNSNTARGYYYMFGAALTAGSLNIGQSGIGTFDKGGGVATISGNTSIGNFANSAGMLTFSSAGTFTTLGTTYVGGSTSGAGGSGTFNLAIPSAVYRSGAFQVFNNGRVYQSAGSLSVTGDFTLNNGTHSHGGGTLGVAGNLTSYDGTQTQSGGWVTVSGALTLDGGSYNLNTGTLYVVGDMILDTGQFTQTGGNFAIKTGHKISVMAGGNWTCTTGGYIMPSDTGISVSSGTFNATGGLRAGYLGSGTVLVDGASAQLIGTSTNYFGWGTGASGTVIFAGGAAGSLGATQIGGSAGAGTLSVGDANVGVATLTLGSGAGTALLELTHANSNVWQSGASTLAIGLGGVGTLHIGTGAFVTGTGVATIGGGGNVIVDAGFFDQQGPLVIDGGTFSASGGNLSVIYPDLSLSIRNDGRVTVPQLAVTSGYRLNIESGAQFTSTGTLALNAPGAVATVDGGKLSAGTIILGADGQLKFNYGTIAITGGDGLTIKPGGPPYPVFGSSLEVRPNQTLEVTNATTIAFGADLTLSGGTLSVGTLAVAGAFQFNAGTLRFTGSDLTISAGQALGNSLAIGLNQRIETTGSRKIIVSSDGLLLLNGGSLAAAGGIDNSGEIQLASAISRLSGGALANNGMLSGVGRIENVLNNATLGTVRSGAADRLLFTASGNSNHGTIQMLGGIVEFQHDLSNSNGAVISGRGTLISSGSLSNSGSMNFTSGPSEIYGVLTNNLPARVLVTGGAHATFYDDVTNQSGSQFKVSDASIAAFLGDVVGLAAFTGNGTTIFEGSASGGPLAAGTSVVNPDGNLTATSIRQNRLIVRGQSTIPQNGATAATSRLNALVIEDGSLDLNDNDLVIDYTGTSPITDIRSNLASGALFSTTANSSVSPKFAIGYTENTTGLSLFSGQSVDSTSLLIAYTLRGDSNLDGKVNTIDFNQLAGSFGQASQFWIDGDFDYDGTVNSIDFSQFVANYGNSTIVGAAPGLGAVIPEPTGLVTSLTTLLALRRRR